MVTSIGLKSTKTLATRKIKLNNTLGPISSPTTDEQAQKLLIEKEKEKYFTRMDLVNRNTLI
jgi:hypothetical protein